MSLLEITSSRCRERGLTQAERKITLTAATNLAVHAPHINGLTLIFRDKNHVLERWRMVDKRDAESTFDFELTRN
jgi:hypothetical protein